MTERGVGGVGRTGCSGRWCLCLFAAAGVPAGVVSSLLLLSDGHACCIVLLPRLQDLDEMEQEVDQMAPQGPPEDCDCGMDAGEELIEGRRGMLAVSSQALLTAVRQA